MAGLPLSFEGVTSRAFEAFIEEIRVTYKDDPEIQQHLKDTPQRMAKMWKEFLLPEDFNITTFENISGSSELVILKDIPFYSLCAHHWLPFFGTATVGYIPGERLVGLSKLARIVDYYAKRPQVQEKLTSDIANAIHHEETGICPMATGVIIKAEHMCMTFRGVQKPGTVTVTSALRGSLRNDGPQRAEFMSLAKD